ncbi:MAG: hypothetical protein SOX46_09865 [Clostridiaceae bacterium]|nr:hypothetical protein [Clostridiaceae bacterium]
MVTLSNYLDKAPEPIGRQRWDGLIHGGVYVQRTSFYVFRQVEAYGEVICVYI